MLKRQPGTLWAEPFFDKRLFLEYLQSIRFENEHSIRKAIFLAS